MPLWPIQFVQISKIQLWEIDGFHRQKGWEVKGKNNRQGWNWCVFHSNLLNSMFLRKTWVLWQMTNKTTDIQKPVSLSAILKESSHAIQWEVNLTCCSRSCILLPYVLSLRSSFVSSHKAGTRTHSCWSPLLSITKHHQNLHRCQ